jgi:hypothetical protein
LTGESGELYLVRRNVPVNVNDRSHIAGDSAVAGQILGQYDALVNAWGSVGGRRRRGVICSR